MATTRYVIAATPAAAEKVMSNLKSARIEADARAKFSRVDVTVTTQATGRLSYTAQGAPVQAERIEDVPVDADTKAEFARLLAELVAERTEAVEAPAPAKPRRAKAARTTREMIGWSSASGWELLYDKPSQGCEVARRFTDHKPEFALVCKATRHVHALPTLVAERAARKAGDWCPCKGH